MKNFIIERNVSLSDEALNTLFQASWPGHQNRKYQNVLSKSLATLTAHQSDTLIGFVNVAWDGGQHGFILDTTVHPEHRRNGLGSQLLGEAIAAAREAGLTWLHVDFEAEMLPFYRKAGFKDTGAGLMRLTPPSDEYASK